MRTTIGQMPAIYQSQPTLFARALFELHTIVALVGASLPQELFVGTDLLDPSVLHNGNGMGVANGGEAVRDDDHRAARSWPRRAR